MSKRILFRGKGVGFIVVVWYDDLLDDQLFFRYRFQTRLYELFAFVGGFTNEI